ncbi:class II fructose-bisphosphate aldolase [Alkalicoccus urumqiensis]|uniref:Sulfofructosephosphate aldolase n=1 Tax=Alkalicoccus urumqiensis TaxID=1548213 RepID=SQIA_ALKUR|nr:class II fructose-bisphosphate aldolase [Alkalicoccus urumqiensis]A0A2P6MHY1.1 RecName: Full=Sulfofructosephosphate aldolase; Short=SFP aldolase [Alkalicoccus urumqiensis]PRO65853.1 tagatose-bisphosphate aldolase [Alkalicoccus urumqiensis]
MAYISGKTMLENAYKEGYGVGAFSAHNAETIQGILEAAEQMKSPIMIQVGQKVIQNVGLEPMKALIDIYMKDVTVPVAVHLDHCRDLGQAMKAIQLGFQSVMFDGSALSFEENAEKTKLVADAASHLGIGSEGEIGKIGGTEDDITVDEKDAQITSEEEALAFADRSRVDYLALSIGTAHGIYKQEPELAFDRIEEISKSLNKPLVMHGGSDVPDADVKKAIGLGIAKINVDTELRVAFTEGMKQCLQDNPNEYHLAHSLGAGKEAMIDKVKEKIRVFGSENKARTY